jgi:hypothetical protein
VSRRLIFRLAVLLFFGIIPAFAQEFSADVVRLKPTGMPTTKIFVHHEMVRFDSMTQPSKSYVLVDLDKRTSSMVIAENKTYVVAPPGHLPASIPLFRIDDPENACPEWNKTVTEKANCKKVGDDTVNGRRAVKYTGTAYNGDTGTAWIDSKLKITIKWEGEKGAAELQNIQEGPQTASLFQIPSDYEKLDPASVRAASKQQKAQPKPPVR